MGYIVVALVFLVVGVALEHFVLSKRARIEKLEDTLAKDAKETADKIKGGL